MLASNLKASASLMRTNAASKGQAVDGGACRRAWDVSQARLCAAGEGTGVVVGVRHQRPPLSPAFDSPAFDRCDARHFGSHPSLLTQPTPLRAHTPPSTRPRSFADDSRSRRQGRAIPRTRRRRRPAQTIVHHLSGGVLDASRHVSLAGISCLLERRRPVSRNEKKSDSVFENIYIQREDSEPKQPESREGVDDPGPLSPPPTGGAGSVTLRECLRGGSLFSLRASEGAALGRANAAPSPRMRPDRRKGLRSAGELHMSAESTPAKL